MAVIKRRCNLQQNKTTLIFKHCIARKRLEQTFLKLAFSRKNVLIRWYSHVGLVELTSSCGMVRITSMTSTSAVPHTCVPMDGHYIKHTCTHLPTYIIRHLGQCVDHLVASSPNTTTGIAHLLYNGTFGTDYTYIV